MLAIIICSHTQSTQAVAPWRGSVTSVVQFCNQEFKVFDVAIIGTNGSEVAYTTAEMFKRRIIKCTEKNCINAKICQVIQPLTNAYNNVQNADSTQQCV